MLPGTVGGEILPKAEVVEVDRLENMLGMLEKTELLLSDRSRSPPLRTAGAEVVVEEELIPLFKARIK